MEATAQNLSDTAPKAVRSAAAGRPNVFGTGTTAHSFVGSSTAGEITEEEDDGTDPESSGVHFDPANPFSLLGQDGEIGGGDGEGGSTESEAKGADLEQQPSSVASAEKARDGAMALSDEERGAGRGDGAGTAGAH
mmetsp:Transcript_16380/g.24813  ORF Transcript_16380/g.24813 Transcript_16380/m.24813 type:complete len:136 (-) Transcript_16380:83-490(-)